MSLTKKTIGNVAKAYSVSTHTLRYYEKIGLLAPIAKDKGGRRIYNDHDLNRLGFIKRAQRMNFSLKDIAQLIALGRLPLGQKPQAQKLVKDKLAEITESLSDLHRLQDDLTDMLNACVSSSEDEVCPILESFKDKKLN